MRFGRCRQILDCTFRRRRWNHVQVGRPYVGFNAKSRLVGRNRIVTYAPFFLRQLHAPMATIFAPAVVNALPHLSASIRYSVGVMTEIC